MYKYYLKERPMDIGTTPRKGLIKFENYDYESQKRFGAWAKAYYDRKLTEEEVQSYELEYGGQEND